jgi:hypothetical protein
MLLLEDGGSFSYRRLTKSFFNIPPIANRVEREGTRRGQSL